MSVAKLFSQLTYHRHALNTLANAMTVYPEVESATAELRLRDYTGESQIEAWVDVELRDGTAVTWWTDIFFKENYWQMEVSLSKTDESGQTTLKVERPPITCSIEVVRSQLFTHIQRAKEMDFYITGVPYVQAFSCRKVQPAVEVASIGRSFGIGGLRTVNSTYAPCHAQQTV